MKLSGRKKRILQYVVDDYISTAQPVSSKSITEKYMPDISSATVRSELAGLEEMGYLTQLHTSSGRVPSIDAYKLYVDELMDKGRLSSKEIDFIRKAFVGRADNLEAVVRNAARVISDLTDYTSVAVSSHSGKQRIVKLDIFRCKPEQALLLIATENILIRDKFIDIPSEMTDEQVSEAALMMQKMFIGKALDETTGLFDTVKEQFDAYREIFESVMSAIEEYVNDEKPEVVLEGEGKILHHPGYNDSEKVKNFLSVVSSKDKLRELLSKNDDDIEVSIKIGGGESDDIPKDCSLVTASYSVSGVKIGTYGVIGPLRMDYQKVVSVLEGVGRILEDMLDNKD